MKVNIICSLGASPLVGGQTTKTQELIKFLQEKTDVDLTDLHDIKKRPLKSLFSIFKGLYKSDKCIIILASIGYFKIVPYVGILNFFLKKSIFEIVIGGIRYEHIEGHRLRKFFESKLKRIYVESNYMLFKYKELGLKNAVFMPNYKSFNPITYEEMIENRGRKELRICTFSRIDVYKGIDVAINVVNQCNKRIGINLVELDIIGPIDESYRDEFENIMSKQKSYIKYIGVIESDKSVDVLNEYDVLLAPTKWITEGFPGAFIDAMAAGLVILSTNLKNFEDIVIDGYNGYLIPGNNTKLYVEKIESLCMNRETLYELRNNSLTKSYEYKAENVLNTLWEDLL